MLVIRPDRMLEVLPIMAYGMLGVFLVTGVIIASVVLLNRLTGTDKQ